MLLIECDTDHPQQGIMPFEPCDEVHEHKPECYEGNMIGIPSIVHAVVRMIEDGDEKDLCAGCLQSRVAAWLAKPQGSRGDLRIIPADQVLRRSTLVGAEF